MSKSAQKPEDAALCAQLFPTFGAKIGLVAVLGEFSYSDHIPFLPCFLRHIVLPDYGSFLNILPFD